MGKFAGGALRTVATFLYFLEFLCSALGLGVFSYFLAKLSIHHLHIANDWKAVEGLVGSAVLYTIFALLLTCFLGGFRVFGYLGILLDVVFCGVFIAVAILTKHGDASCSGIVNTPIGYGNANAERASLKLGTACKLTTAVFATALIAAFLFAISAVLQYFLVRNHLSEKKYGPSPSNNYTSGYGSRLFKRKPKATKDAYGETSANGTNTNGVHDAELGAVGTAHGRPSAETGYTGTTTADHNDAYGTGHKYESTPAGQTNAYEPAGSGYQAGQGVNPYGYTQSGHPTGTAVNY